MKRPQARRKRPKALPVEVVPSEWLAKHGYVAVYPYEYVPGTIKVIDKDKLTPEHRLFPIDALYKVTE